MIILDSTNETLEIATSSTAAIDVVVAYADHTSTTFSPGSQETAITTATTTTVLAAPAASTQRQVKMMTIGTKGTTANTVTIKKDVGGTEYVMMVVTLQPGENLIYSDGEGFSKRTANGEDAVMNVTDKRGPITAQSRAFMKVSSAPEAAGQLHSLAAASGLPGAWAPGTPGLNGRATDGTQAADAGAFNIANAASGINFLTSFEPTASVACLANLLDLLWVNTGLVVTSTSAQAITPVALPARDGTGTTGGVDVLAGILITTATTQAGVVTCTISYTNSAGVAGRTGTCSLPATGAAGTIVPFSLQAGDGGVRSVQSVTLAATLTAGAISLVLYRPLITRSCQLANTGNSGSPPTLNVRLYSGVCALLAFVATSTATLILQGTLNVEEK